ncbi:hypothetical protein [Xanthovirga aplysinae]|uniref:hypothetical protein n=1 Tax=Xanthovirga aplysinae TaxID=2529853 RepID=UPI0012BCEB1B|nr:hypothetical protein [Xanthovirga aplysinae]MTI32743.1 hypothetical protein [Xanthovirga aplysinae]
MRIQLKISQFRLFAMYLLPLWIGMLFMSSVQQHADFENQESQNQAIEKLCATSNKDLHYNDVTVPELDIHPIQSFYILLIPKFFTAVKAQPLKSYNSPPLMHQRLFKTLFRLIVQPNAP